MAVADALIGELEQEAATTRRVLERVPADKLAWKPHAKSMSLGKLALHIAESPGNITQMAAPESFEQPEATSGAQLLPALEESLAKSKAVVSGFGDVAMMETWSVAAGDKTLMSMPRTGFLRAIMLNH